MKVIIQQNWTSGLGDLYTGACEYLNYVKILKELGYETELVFSVHSGLGGGNKYINEVKFEEIFDKNAFKVFDKISTNQWAHTEKTLDGLDYKFTVHGCDSPGVHWWDCFCDVLPENVQIPWYGSDRFLYTNVKPEIFAKFNREVYKRRNEFIKKYKNKFNFLQIRVADLGNQSLDGLEPMTKTLKKNIKLNGEFFLVGSNHEYVIEKLTSLKNVFSYKYKNLDVFPNDHPYYFYHNNLEKKMYLDRIYDNLAEMTSLQYAKKIYQYTLFGWTSNFLFYGFTKNKKLNFTSVNHKYEIVK